MKKQIGILYFCLALSCLNSYSQGDIKYKPVELESDEAYLVNVYIDTIFTGWRFKELGRQYNICKISVNRVYYMADTNFVTKSQLLHAKYMLYHDTIISEHQNVDISLVSTDKRDIFFMGGILTEEKINAKIFRHHAMVYNISIGCRRINKFLRLHLNQ